MRIRFWDAAFILCNVIAIAFLSLTFMRANASANPDSSVLSANTTNIPAPEYAEQQLAAMASQINTLRAEKGLKPLKQSTELDTVADLRAADMSKNAYYAHRSPTGELFDDIMTRQGITDIGYACENLNMAETSDAGGFIKSWLNSGSHRQCLLDDRTDSAGYAITKIHVSNGIPINQYVVVAIYTQTR